jgi:hypothetical protein
MLLGSKSRFSETSNCRPPEAQDGIALATGPDEYQDVNIRYRSTDAPEPIPDDIYRIHLEFQVASGPQQKDFCLNCSPRSAEDWRIFWQTCSPGEINLTQADPPCS